MLTIGVLGAGITGKSHIRLLQEIDAYKLIGFFEPSKKIADAVSEEFGLYSFPSPEALLEACEVIDITSPTIANYKVAEKALRKSIHVFLEKPFSNSVSETKALIRLAMEANSKVQIGQTERFNAAFIASRLHINDPLLIETQRQYTVNTISDSTSLVMDLMIHDIDIVLSLVKANIRTLHATGIAVVNESPDIVNARIEFDNGAVANLSVNRIALENKHHTTFFKRDAYVNVDFKENAAQIVYLNNEFADQNNTTSLLEDTNVKQLNNISLKKIDVPVYDAVKLQLESFSAAILNNTRPLVPIDDGYHAMAVANKIIELLRLNANFAATKTIIA